jgi:CubicO group peptidase (beta-lactamase class C family)
MTRRMILRIAVVGTIGLLSTTLLGQVPAATRTAVTMAGAAATTGLIPERAALIDRALQRYVDENKVAGLVALALQDGQPIYEKAFGWADKEAARRMTTDTVFRIASQTKALTSVAILQLLEEGRLTLGTRASQFISTFANTKVAVADERGRVTQVPARRAITIRDLLTHTAGISYGTEPAVAALYEAKALGPAAGFGWYTADKNEDICETMERLGTLPFVAQPGEAWVYGYNTDILGCIVQKISGVPLDEYLRAHITGPLGLTNTQFFPPASARDRLAAVYATGEGGLLTRAPDGARGQGAYVDGPRRSFAGGAGLTSTARDYARFLEAIRRGGSLDGVRILSPPSVKLMTTNQVGTLHSTTGLGWGLGFETVDHYGANGMSGEGAFGWGGAYGSIYRVDPEARLVLVLMIQLIPNATDIREVFPTLIYQALR